MRQWQVHRVWIGCVVLSLGIAASPLVAAPAAYQAVPPTVTPDIINTPPPMMQTPEAGQGTPSGGTGSRPAATAQPVRTNVPATTAQAGTGDDPCDPNGDLLRPCAVATETDIANLSFVRGNVDVFSVYLKGKRAYTISATPSGTGGLDPVVTVFLANDTTTAIAENDDIVIGNPAAQVVVAVPESAWYLVRVTNTSPGTVQGLTYTFAAKSVIPANGGSGTGGSTGGTTETLEGDIIGNAYSPDRAVPVAWGVPYDLTMECPDDRPQACYDGRHTFLLVPVKSRVALMLLSYDLGAGVDTLFTLYAPDASQVQTGGGRYTGWREVARNDDVVPGWTLRSQLAVIPTWQGTALLVISPSAQTDLPPLSEAARVGRYRLMIGAPNLPAVVTILAAQTDLPPQPTARPTGQAAAAAVSTATGEDTREVIKETCPTGRAMTVTRAPLYAAAPPAANDLVAAYPPDAGVALLGSCYRGWVKVQPDDSVTPGWMWSPLLRPDGPLTNGAGGSQTGGLPGGSGTLPGVPGLPGTTAMPTVIGSMPQPTRIGGENPGTGANPGTGGVPQPTETPIPLPVLAVRSLQPTPVPLPQERAPVARTITVRICGGNAGLLGRDCDPVYVNVLVELLVVANERIVTSSVTGSDGSVVLTGSVRERTQIAVRVPALGLWVILGADQQDVSIRIPTPNGGVQ